jgi:hypothetical protein
MMGGATENPLHDRFRIELQLSKIVRPEKAFM